MSKESLLYCLLSRFLSEIKNCKKDDLKKQDEIIIKYRDIILKEL